MGCGQRCGPEDVGGQGASLQELGLQRLLGELLNVEIDGELNVASGNRVDVFVDESRTMPPAASTLEDLFAPLPVQLVFHRLFDAEGADEFVGVVVLRLVLRRRSPW